MPRIFAPLRRWGARPGSLAMLVAGLAIGALTFGSLGSFMVYANSEQFCANSCHEMTSTVALEYKNSIHDINRSGMRATCNDCHVPHEHIPNYLAKMGLFSDLWGHFVTHSIDTPAKFEAKRYELAKRVWVDMKANDSRECRFCHTAAKMDAAKQTTTAKKRHDKMRKENLTCIDCHFAISHKEPDGPGPKELGQVATGKQ
ncbi:NapC/NirT family cytochrome c [Niveibacterium umoris]|uniref:Cytochrome c-type protein n=1 Tax=Niveibacterium umoris TaxID=1193620 RepID=A0A840BNC8_9RHOO|nr:NapC/NirT family cytochrome c [Niveibacterium umoris]MBB4014143.1 cytochrome c-type protein NapC [Niveibacterium umoris]